jgi:intein-encoded DNA endonuclease-like protein
MTVNQKIRRVKQLKKSGLSFRAIEQRLRKTLGVGKASNGTTAFRLLQKAA